MSLVNDKAVYLNTNTLNGIMFPEKKLAVTPSLVKMTNANSYLTKIFRMHLSYFNHRTFRPEDDLAGNYTPIVSKLILTNPDRTGVWLYCDPNTCKVSIPGGYVTKQDVQYVMSDLGMPDGMVVIREALIRKLYEEFYGETVGYSMYESSKITARSLMERIEDVVYPKTPSVEYLHGSDELFYLYKTPGQQRERAITFYHVLTVKLHTPSEGYIPVIPKGLLFVKKGDWEISKRCKTMWEKDSILGECIGPVATDMRYSDEYSPILDAIFHTTELF